MDERNDDCGDAMIMNREDQGDRGVPCPGQFREPVSDASHEGLGTLAVESSSSTIHCAPHRGQRSIAGEQPITASACLCEERGGSLADAQIRVMSVSNAAAWQVTEPRTKNMEIAGPSWMPRSDQAAG